MSENGSFAQESIARKKVAAQRLAAMGYEYSPTDYVDVFPNGRRITSEEWLEQFALRKTQDVQLPQDDWGETE